MSLLSKLEKLERIATARDKSASLGPDPELIAALGRILGEVIARPEPTIHERIVELREQIKRNEIEEPEHAGYFERSVLQLADQWLRSELARREGELAKLQ